MKEINVNRIFALAGFVLSGALLFGTRQFPERAVSAARYVNFLGITMGVLSLILLLSSIRENERNSERVVWIESPLHFVETLIGIIVYFVLINWLGFFVSSLLFLIILGWFLGYRKPLKLIASSVGLLLFIYFVFVRFLTVPVPSGILGGIL